MMDSYSKLQSIKQMKKPGNVVTKPNSKLKMNAKRKSSKEKKAARLIESKKHIAKVPVTLETNSVGYKYIAKTMNSDLYTEKHSQSKLANYVPVIKRTSSLEDHNHNVVSAKQAQNCSLEERKVKMDLSGKASKWEENGSISPANTRSKYTKEKLRNLTTNLGTGASRNSSKGVMFTSNFSKAKHPSSKFMTQGSSFYKKDKSSSSLLK